MHVDWQIELELGQHTSGNRSSRIGTWKALGVGRRRFKWRNAGCSCLWYISTVLCFLLLPCTVGVWNTPILFQYQKNSQLLLLHVVPLLFAVCTVNNLATVIEVETLPSSLLPPFQGFLPRPQQWENTTHPTTATSQDWPLSTCYLLLHFPQLTNYTNKKQAEEEERSGATIQRLRCE